MGLNEEKEMQMKRILSIFFSLLLISAAADSQTLTAKAPSRVQTGDNFRLTYTLDTQDATDFRVGEIPDGLELITGPYTSTQHSIHIVNGHTTSSSSTTYTIILCANKPGSYTIPAAHVKVKGNSIASKEVKMEVSGTASSTGGAPRMHEDTEAQQGKRDAGTPIKEKDLFITVTASKHRVHEQEPILLTYKVYTLVDLVQLEGKMPDLTGFHTQEISLPQQKSFHVESYNGKNYRCVTWCQYVMFPQMTGKLEIPSITFNGTVIQQNRNVDPFEAFFNGGSGYIEVKRSIKAPAVTIQVDPLPTRPASFSGGVGKFSISAQIDNQEVKANEPVTVRVVVSGSGNIKLIKQPVVSFPKDFDTYDAKVTDKTRLTTNGVEGNMVYDFLAVPRNQGEYDIPAVEFTYYDTGKNQYNTIKTQDFHIKVAKGEKGTAVSDFDGQQRDEDIRPIKTGDMRSSADETMFFGSTNYWLTIALLIVMFAALMVLFRHRAMRNADVVGTRIKKANKVATKRLRSADRLMRQGRQNEFYDEVLHALWGYVGDRLSIPVAQLTRDNITDRLKEHNVDDATIATFVGAIDECEFERYAPGDKTANMNKTYTSAMTAITDIETAMKKKRKRKPTATALLLLLIALHPIGAQAEVTKEMADEEYNNGNYQQAAKDYEEICDTTANAAVYYNLGNTYYRLDNIPRAVLSYERALLLSPADADIKFNLEKARAKTIDKITPQSEMFFVTWWRTLTNITDVDGWAYVAVSAMVLAFVMALLYLFAGSMALRKIGFFIAALSLAVFIFSNVFAFRQKQALEVRSGAIVMSPSVTMKKTPADGGTDGGVIHEGTKVTIIDDTMEDWKCVKLADGRTGWIPATDIEKI